MTEKVETCRPDIYTSVCTINIVLLTDVYYLLVYIYFLSYVCLHVLSISSPFNHLSMAWSSIREAPHYCNLSNLLLLPPF